MNITTKKTKIFIDISGKNLTSFKQFKWKKELIFHDIIVRANDNFLTNLEGIPKYIAANITELYVNNNPITNLKGCPPNLDKLCINHAKLEDLEYISPNLTQLFAQFNNFKTTMYLPQILKRLMISNRDKNDINKHNFINNITYYMPDIVEYNNHDKYYIMTNFKEKKYYIYCYILAYYGLSKYLYKDIIKKILFYANLKIKKKKVGNETKKRINEKIEKYKSKKYAQILLYEKNKEFNLGKDIRLKIVNFI